MRRPAFFATAILIVLAACTQDFDQFNPSGAGGTATTTTTSTSTSAGGGGSGAAGGATTTSTVTMGEDCLNGVDDNGDGAIDCADTACVDYECVALPGTGTWNGPGILYDGDPSMVPSCPAEFPMVAMEGLADPVQQDATCSACTCSTPGITCNVGILTSHGSGTCGGSSDNHTQPNTANMCATINASANTSSYDATSPTVSAGNCTPSGGVPTVPMAQANRAVRLCSVALSDAGCGASDERCVPSQVGTPFEGQVCIWRDGDTSCPNAYSNKHLFATDLNDTRDCSNCNCGGAAGFGCTVTTHVYSDGNCTNQLATVPNNGTSCVQAGQGASIDVTKTITAGSCPSSGGNPTGSVSLGANLTTVCCR